MRLLKNVLLSYTFDLTVCKRLDPRGLYEKAIRGYNFFKDSSLTRIGRS